jgi:hypothetical protein
MPIYAEQRDAFLETLDEPRHTLEYGGVNGNATIRGVATGSNGRAGELGQRRKQLGVVMEPVPVLMRDAVTLDTAVRLLGVNRVTLQRAAHRGDIPALKTGPGNAPYLVRLRDVLTYFVTMWTERRARTELAEGDLYRGFPEWLVREVAEAWPPSSVVKVGPWQPRHVKLKRGGRPRVKDGGAPTQRDPQRPGYSVNGKRLGRPPAATHVHHDLPEDVALGIEEKGGGSESNHSQALPPEQPPVPQIDPTTLPKWHPLWRRPAPPETTPLPDQ